jgi:hypothetical protein
VQNAFGAEEKKGGQSMCGYQESDLGGVDSDEKAVEIVAKAYANRAPNAADLRLALLKRLYDRHRKRLAGIAGARLRQQRKTDDPDQIAGDEIDKFCQRVASGLQERPQSVAAYLTTMVKAACTHCGPSGLPPWMEPRQPCDGDERGPGGADGDEIHTDCLRYLAILALPPNYREVLLIDAGWHQGFNTWNGGPPRRRGDTPAVAIYLRIKPPTVARWRTKARDKLRQLLEEQPTAELIRIAFEAAMREVKRRPGKLGPRFLPPLFSEYIVRLVRHAYSHGLAGATDLLRTAVALDFQGQPEHAFKLADDLEKRIQGQGALSTELRIETAKFMDHLARDLEQEKRFSAALDLVERGLKLLGDVIPADFGPHCEGSHDNISWRALFQFAILTRRAYELRQAQAPGNSGHVCLLSRARAVLKRLLIRSDLMAQRIEAAHQEAVCDLLVDHLDDAEEGFRRCMAARDEYDNTEPGREHLGETEFRRAYDHRRLAHVLARRAGTAQNDEARDRYYSASLAEFKKTVEISAGCGFNRYVLAVQQDARDLLPEPYRAEIDSFICGHV